MKIIAATTSKVAAGCNILHLLQYITFLCLGFRYALTASRIPTVAVGKLLYWDHG